MEISKDDINFYNAKIFNNQEKYRKEQKMFEFIKGKIPIIISAPHCVEHTRNGQVRCAEGETGAIAQIIAKETQCYTIFKTYNNEDDSNYDLENNYYKTFLKKAIKNENIILLIDLHGADTNRDFDIDIGTDNLKNIENKKYIVYELVNKLHASKIENIKIDSVFKASSVHTICKYIHKETNIPCVQLEISGKYRYIENINGINKFLNGIISYIKEIANKI